MALMTTAIIVLLALLVAARSSMPQQPLSDSERSELHMLRAENARLKQQQRAQQQQQQDLLPPPPPLPPLWGPRAARQLPLLFMNMEDILDTTPEPPPKPPPPPPPSYENASWFVAAGVNANGDRAAPPVDAVCPQPCAAPGLRAVLLLRRISKKLDVGQRVAAGPSCL